jgi:hypothetical protein
MDINDLIKQKLIKRIKVQRPSDAVVEAGNQRSSILFKNPMSGNCCAGNSQSIVEAMKAKNESNWNVVQGFGIPNGESKPRVHVWVRKGSRHYDPTWTRFKWWLEDLKYYRLTRPLAFGPTERDTLNRLKDLAEKWKLDLLGGV